MKTILLLLLLSAVTQVADGQPALTLQECYILAESNYPQIRQRELVQRTNAYSVENIGKGRLPQLILGGQVSYQSEVTQIPVEMPGVEPLSKDQYRIFGEVTQTVYHGGLVARRRAAEELNGKIEGQKLEVDLYQVRARVNELYFGILLIREQLRQSKLVRQNLLTSLKKVQASIANGTAIPGAGDALLAELLSVDQRMIETESAGRAYRQMLGIFLNQAIDTGTVLKRPVFNDVPAEVARPELDLFDEQLRSIELNQNVLSSTKAPRLELFLQGGYGRPGLDMLDNEFNFYYIGGIRLNWPLSGYYTLRKEKEILMLRRQSLEVQKETFLFNSEVALHQQAAEIAKLRRMIEVDDEIIALRTQIRQTAAVQLEEGVISSPDFIREINAEDQAKQSRAHHETQLLLAQAKYLFTSGQE